METRKESGKKVQVIFYEVGTKKVTGKSPFILDKDNNVKTYIEKATLVHSKKINKKITTEIKEVK